MKTKKTTVRHIRFDDNLWDKLNKMAAPEHASILIRKVLREFTKEKGD